MYSRTGLRIRLSTDQGVTIETVEIKFLTYIVIDQASNTNSRYLLCIYGAEERTGGQKFNLLPRKQHERGTQKNCPVYALLPATIKKSETFKL